VPRYVALLRGVNVGGAKRVPMAAWRTMLQTSECSDIQTLLNSGNAVFTAESRSAAAHAQTIHAQLRDELGVDVAVAVKLAREFSAIVESNPFSALADDDSRMLIAFAMKDDQLQALAPLSALILPPERFSIGKHAAYLWCANGILACQAAEAMLGKKGQGVTTRNRATVGKILALLAA
jgi:uncharacterized protein (DUF1697 family)